MCAKLLESYSETFEAVIPAKGASTKYWVLSSSIEQRLWIFMDMLNVQEVALSMC